MEDIKNNINKCNLCILLMYIYFTILTIIYFIIDYNVEDVDKNCILPQSNLETLKTKYDVNETQINNCEISSGASFSLALSDYFFLLTSRYTFSLSWP